MNQTKPSPIQFTSPNDPSTYPESVGVVDKVTPEHTIALSDWAMRWFLNWYESTYSAQLLNGSGINPELIKRNIAVVKDAVSSYRDYLRYGA